MIKIIHERSQCIGCNACVAVNSINWEMNGDGKSDLFKGKFKGENQELELKDIGNNKEAAEVCPVNCIHIIENGIKLI